MNIFSYYKQLIKHKLFLLNNSPTDFIVSNIFKKNQLEKCLKVAHPKVIEQLQPILPKIYKEKIIPEAYFEHNYKEKLIIKYNIKNYHLRIFLSSDVSGWELYKIDRDYDDLFFYIAISNGNLSNIPLPLHLLNLL